MLASAGLLPLPSSANFVTARSPDGASAAQAVEHRLAERGILVRGLANYDMPDALRITVGTPSEMHQFERALSEILPIAASDGGLSPI
jgi:histidinol-phosphate aminotransferase